jgi:hypothetical protein
MSRFVSVFTPLCICLTMLFCFPSSLFPQDQNQGLQPAKILEVDAHSEGRMVNYVNETPAPVYDRYPYYDMRVRVGSDCYVVRFESQTGYYPANWKADSTVQARMANGALYLVRYDGAEVPTRIVGRCD